MDNQSYPWIPERSDTRLSEADLNILSKLGKQGLEWRLEPKAFTGREIGREDDLLYFLVGCPVDVKSTGVLHFASELRSCKNVHLPPDRNGAPAPDSRCPACR